MAKIFVHFARKRAKPALQPLILEPEDPERHRARVAAERREAERIQAERRRRMFERSAARVLHSTPTAKDPSDRDADWFAAHPNRNYLVRRAVADEIPAHLDQRCWKWMAICQLQPGVRVRLPFNLPYGKRALLNFVMDEEGAKMMFDMVAADAQARSLEGVAP
jgi:hypothetical protein